MFEKMCLSSSFSALIFILLFIEVFAGSSEQCTSGFHSRERIQEWGEQSRQSLGEAPHQQLFPSIKFTCNGTLKRWILKIRPELSTSTNPVYPEIQIWRRSGTSSNTYRKVGSSRIDMNPLNRQTQIYSVAPNPPLRFESGDIFGLWESTNHVIDTREVENIRQNLTDGFNYVASSGPLTEVSMESQHQFRLGTPLVVVETDPPGCDTFIDLERLATHSTKLPCCDAAYYLYIIPGMTFTCNGNITGWTAGTTWIQSFNPQIIPELQIWRNELDSGSAYSRVASVQLNPIPPANINVNGGYFKKRVFSNSFNTPISFRKGDVLGLMQSPQGQLRVHMTTFPYVSLPRNYVYTSSGNFSNLHNVDLQLPTWTFIELLRPLIALDISAESNSMPISEPQPTTTTTPDVTSLPNPSPLTTQTLGTTPTLSRLLSSSIIPPQPSPLSVQPDRTTHTPDTETNTDTGLLESKHIFGIIVGGVLLIVLIILGVVIIGFLAILTARRRNRRQFIETFVETTDNDAYTIRKTTLHARLNNGHVTQNLHEALIPHSNDNSVATKSNTAYLTSRDATMIRSHQAKDISVSTFTGTQNGSLKHSQPSDNSIATERNIAYLTSSEASTMRGHQANNTKRLINGPPSSTLNHTPDSTPSTIETARNIVYSTNNGTSVVRNHQANDISVSTFIGPQNGNLNHTLNSCPSDSSIATERNIAYSTNNETVVRNHPINTSDTSSVIGTAAKGDMNHTVEMKVNEAYHTKVSTLGHRLPDDTEALVMMPQVSMASDEGSGSGMGLGQGNRGQNSHPVKPNETTNLPSAEQVKNS